jgi:hypothetical protein
MHRVLWQLRVVTDWRWGLLPMDWLDVVVLVEIALSLWVGTWLVFRRPTGSRIVRYARRYLRRNPRASEGDLREALRQRFLGGTPLIGLKASGIAEAVRDRWFPLDRDAIARRIEAAIQIVLGEDSPNRQLNNSEA